MINSEKLSILDLCGSWISHLPLPLPLVTKVMGIGMNEKELAKNEAYTEWRFHDLNDSENQKWTWLLKFRKYGYHYIYCIDRLFDLTPRGS